MKQIKVVFDLDNTLMDAEKIKKFFRDIGGAHGYSDEESKEIYRRARNREDGKIAITDTRYINFLKKDLIAKGKTLEMDKVDAIFSKMKNQGKGLLIVGAKELLDYCHACGFEYWLLSLGVKEWQQKKIGWAGLDKYFNENNTVYTVLEDGGKFGAMVQIFGPSFDGANTILFNDRPDESKYLLERFPNLKIFLRRDRRDARQGEDQWRELAELFHDKIEVAEDLNSLLDRLKKYVSQLE